MGILDDIIPGVVKDVLSNFASGVIVRTSTQYDIVEGTEVTSDPVEYPVSHAPAVDYTDSQVDGTNIIKGDMRIEVAASGLTIVPTSETDVYRSASGDVLKIVSVGRVMAGDTVAMWVLQCRR